MKLVKSHCDMMKCAKCHSGVKPLVFFKFGPDVGFCKFQDKVGNASKRIVSVNSDYSVIDRTNDFGELPITTFDTQLPFEVICGGDSF
jgi:hypothetical protein